MKQDDEQKTSVDLIVKTNTVNETLDFGRKLGGLLKPGDVIALVGELAAGKTWLAKGIAFGLGVPEHEYVNSPAYDLIHEYQGQMPIYHMDFYRIEAFSEEDGLWLGEYLDDEGICIIEWANKFIDRLVDHYLQIELFPVTENQRELHITGIGTRNKEIIEGLKQQ